MALRRGTDVISEALGRGAVVERVPWVLRKLQGRTSEPLRRDFFHYLLLAKAQDSCLSEGCFCPFLEVLSNLLH